MTKMKEKLNNNIKRLFGRYPLRHNTIYVCMYNLDASSEVSCKKFSITGIPDDQCAE